MFFYASLVAILTALYEL